MFVLGLVKAVANAYLQENPSLNVTTWLFGKTGRWKPEEKFTPRYGAEFVKEGRK